MAINGPFGDMISEISMDRIHRIPVFSWSFSHIWFMKKLEMLRSIYRSDPMDPMDLKKKHNDFSTQSPGPPMVTTKRCRTKTWQQHTTKVGGGRFKAYSSFGLASRGSYLGVSQNGGIPKSSILIWFSIINHPFWGTPICGNTHLL